MSKNAYRLFIEFIKVVVISLVIILPIRYFLFQPFYVSGASMEPSFYDHEYLIIDEFTYRFDAPSRGDIVVFHYPLNTNEIFIKRVIGLPGEKIQFKEGKVYIFNDANPDGSVLDEPYLVSNTETYSYGKDTVTLGPGEYYLLGDNRTDSQDSRIFGPVKRNLIIGRVILRGWPLDRAGIFTAPAYNLK